MAAKKCLICNSPFRGRVDAITCSPRCRKRLQQLRFSLAHDDQLVNKPGSWRKAAVLLIVGLFGVLSILFSALPQKAQAITASSNLNFQARLLTNTGAIVPDGNYNIEFKIYKSQSANGSAQGTCVGGVTDDCLWIETRTGANTVSVTNGYFSVNLGSVNAFINANTTLNWDQQYYLTMRIGGTGTPSWEASEMLNSGNRIALTSVPLAFRANQLAVAGTNEQILQFASSTFGQATTINLQDPGATTANLCYETTGGATAHTCAAASGGSGYIQNSTGGPQSANFNIISAASGSIGAVVHANASQSVDILDVNNSSSTVYFGIGSDGSLSSSPATAGTITLGTSTETGTITLGQYSGASTSTIAIGNNASSSSTQNINIGNSGAGINNINLGSTSSTSSTSIKGGTGASAVALSSGAGGGIALTTGNNGSGAAGNITLTTGTSSSGNASIIAKSSTNSNAAFQVQNASGVNILNVDTSANVITSTQANLIVTDLSTPTSPNVAFSSNSTGNISGAAGTTYYYKITALNAVGESLGSSEVNISTASFTQLSTPSAPTATKAGFDTGPTCGSNGCVYKITYTTANGETAASAASNGIANSTGNVIVVSFTACNSIPGCSGINVYRSRSGGSYQLLTGTGCNGLAPSSTSCSDDINTGGDSGIAPPSAFATTNLNTLNVSWTGVTGATSYRIYRGTSSNGESAYQTSASSPFADSSASGGTAGSVPSRSTVAQIGLGISSPTANLDIRGTALFKNTADSTTAFQVQNAAGTTILNVDTSGGVVAVTGNQTVSGTINTDTLGASALTFSGANPTISASTSNTGLTLQANGNGQLNLNTATTGAVSIGNATGTVTSNGNTSIASNKSFTANGAATFVDATNSTTAFQVQNASSSSALTVDTTQLNTLISNQSFENNSTTGWAAINGASIAATSGQHYVGSYGLDITTNTTTGAGAKYTVGATLSTSTTYTLSFYAKSSSALSALTASYAPDGTTATETDCAVFNSSRSVVTTAWTRYYCTIDTPTTATNSNAYIAIKQNDTTNRHIYIDAVQIEAGTAITQGQVGETGFESALTNWAAIGTGATAVKSSADHYNGSNDLLITDTSSPAANHGAKYTTANTNPRQLNTSTTYTLSFWAKASGSNFSTLIAGYARDGSTQSDCTLNSNSVVTTGWTYYNCSITTDGTAPAATAYIYIEHSGAAATTWMVDDVQLTNASYVVYGSGFSETKISLNGLINSPVALQNTVDSTTAFSIQNTAGTSIFIANTTSSGSPITVTTSNVNSGIFLAGSSSQNLGIYTNLGNGSYNPITVAGDRAFIFQGASSGSPGGGLVLAPWSGSASGLRLDSSGNLTENGTLTSTGAASVASLTIDSPVNGQTNAANAFNAKGSTTLGNTAGNYAYPFEIQNSSAGNSDRLQAAHYRRATGSGWQDTAFRLQYAVDNSFTDGSKAYLEVGADDPNSSGGGFISLGTAGSDRLVVTSTGAVGIGGNTNPAGLLSVGASNQFQVDSSGNITTSGNAAINGGSITSGASSFNLLGSPTTVTAFGSATNITLGTSGADTINLGNGGADNINVGAGATINPNASGTLNIGTSNVTTLTIGNNTAANTSALVLQAGKGSGGGSPPTGPGISVLTADNILSSGTASGFSGNIQITTGAVGGHCASNCLAYTDVSQSGSIYLDTGSSTGNGSNICIGTDSLANCVNSTPTAGHASEVYIGPTASFLTGITLTNTNLTGGTNAQNITFKNNDIANVNSTSAGLKITAQASLSGNNTTGIALALPAFTTSGNTSAINGLGIASPGAINSSSAGSITWNGFNVTTANVTQGSGGSATANGANITLGTITTNGTQNGINITPSNSNAAGTENGINIGNITAGAATENAIKIGTGWDNQISGNSWSVDGSGNLTAANVTVQGTSLTATSATTVTLGTTAGSATTTINAGTGNLNLNTNSSSASIIAKSSTNSATAFQVQNATGATIFNVNTTNNTIGTGNTNVASTNSQALTIKTGDANGSTSNSGNLTIDVGTATQTVGNITIGTNNASNVTVGTTANNATQIFGGSNSSIQFGTNNFAVANTGVVTLKGGTAADITTSPTGAQATSITIQTGTTSNASSTGGSVTIQGGNESNATSPTGGTLTLQGGNTTASGAITGTATGGNVALQGGNASGSSGARNGGNVTIDAGTGTSANGNISIGTVNVPSAITIGAASQTGTITLGQSNQTNTISIGSVSPAGTATQTINIGNGALNSASISSESINIGSGNITGPSVSTIRIGTGGINGIAAGFNILIGTGGSSNGTDTVTIGSNGSDLHQTIIQGGSGTLVSSQAAITLQTYSTGDIIVGSSTQTGLIDLGLSTQTNTISIGSANPADTKTQTINIGNGNANGTTSGGVTVNIANGTPGTNATNTTNIGTGAGKNLVTIGSTTSTSASNIYGGTNGISLTTGANAGGAAGNITLTTGTSSSGNASIIAKSSTNSTSAFQVQNSAGIQLINVDTTTTNLVSNGSFEVNATGWTARGSASAPARDTTFAAVGIAAGKVVTTAAANDGAKYAVGLTSNAKYTIFVSARMANGSSMSTLQIGRAEDGSTDTSCLTAQTINSTGWTNFSCTFTTGTTSGSPYIYIKQTDATARTFYIDAVQLINLSVLTNPSVEAAIAGNWALKGSATVTKDATQFQDGANSLKVVTTAAAGDGAKQAITLSDSTNYYLSFYGLLDSGSAAFATMEAGYSSDGSTDNTSCITAQTLVSTGWTQFTCSFQTPASHSGTPYFYIKQTNAAVHTFYLDNISLTAGSPAVGAYQEGKLQLNGIINSAVILQNQTNSTAAFQVQNSSGQAVLAVDTTNGQSVLGSASALNGQLVFNNSTNANTVTISSGVTSTPYSIILPTAGAASFGQCIQTTGSSLSQLTFGACTATGLGKNVADVSSNGSLASNANLYTFSNTTANASGVLKLDNGTSTNSTLVVTASGNPTSGQALIFASNTNASPTNNLLDLQAGAGPTSVFSVNAAGAVLAASNINTSGGVYQIGGSNILTSSALTFTAAGTISSTGANNLSLNSGTNGDVVVTPGGTGSFKVVGDNDSNAQINSTFTGTGPSQTALTVSLTDNATAAGTSYGLKVVNNDNGSNVGVPTALAYLQNANAAETISDGALIEQTGAGTLTNGLEIKQSAGTLTNGVTFTGTFNSKLISSTNFNVSNAGVITLQGGQTADILAATNSSANGTGPNLTIHAGDASSTSCGTACTGGNLTLQAGSATGASGTTRNGGNLVLKGGTGATANGNVLINTGPVGSTSVTELQLDTLNSTGTDTCGSTNTGAVIYGATTSGAQKQVDSSNTAIGHILGCVKLQGGSTYGWQSLDNYVDVFKKTTSGSGSYTFPTGATVLTAIACGAGGGGAGAGGTNGGGGGGGGAFRTATFTIADIGGSSVGYSVGTGGAHGAAGSNGSNGAATLLGSGGSLLRAGGGGGGINGTTSGKGGAGGSYGNASNNNPFQSSSITLTTLGGVGVGGFGAYGGVPTSTGGTDGGFAETGGGGAGGGSPSTGIHLQNPQGGNGGNTEFGGGAGGGGGAFNNNSLDQTPTAGGFGGDPSPSGSTASAGSGAADNTNGDAAKAGLCGGGGGGGDGQYGGNATAGGNGAAGGGGGGGGGLASGGSNAAGGDGGSGSLIIIAW